MDLFLGLISWAIIVWAIYRLYRRFRRPKVKMTVSYELNTAPAERDAWDTGFLRGSDSEITTPTEASISYVDSKGQRTQRDISISYSYLDIPEPAVLAFCQLRKQTRTFVISRIREYVDLSTGEVVSDIPAHLQAIHEATPEFITAKAMDAEAVGLGILASIAGADSAITKRERQIMKAYLHSMRPEVDPEWEVLDREIRNVGFYKTKLKAQMLEIKNEGGDRLAALSEAVTAMRTCRKKPNPETEVWLKNAEQILFATTQETAS